jgi:hypothetical protein
VEIILVIFIEEILVKEAGISALFESHYDFHFAPLLDPCPSLTFARKLSALGIILFIDQKPHAKVRLNDPCM